MLGLLACLFVGFAEDPQPSTVPAIVERSPRVKEQVKPLDPTPIDVGRFRWYGVENYTGPVTWEPNDETIIGFRETTEKTVFFGVIQGLTEPDFADVPAGSVIVWGKKKGTATIKAYGVVNGRSKLLVTKSFTVDGGAPQPPPTPQPTPVPTPPNPPAPVKVDRLSIVVITENEQASANRSTLFADAALTSRIRDKGHTWKVIDKDIKQYDRASNSLIEPPELSTYLAEARGKPLPFVVLADAKTGKKLFADSVSGSISPAELLALITKAGG